MKLAFPLFLLLSLTAPLVAQQPSIDEIEPVNLLEETEEASQPEVEPITVDLTPVTRESVITAPVDPEPATEAIAEAPTPNPAVTDVPETAVEESTPPTENSGGALTVEEVIEEIKEAESNEPEPTPQPRVIPKSYGDTTGTAYIGHRAVVDRYAGWGWIKSDGSSWSRGQWSVIEEIPLDMPVPGRFLAHPNNDDDTQYKLYGEWADYKAYEPNYDVFVPVFKLKGFELIGKANKPSGLRPPRGTNMSSRSGSVPGGGGARNNPFNR
jgi:hypothetical protein